MLSNNFKSKARNIAIKSFFQEMKKRGWYIPVVIGSAGVLKYIKDSPEDPAHIVDVFVKSLYKMQYEPISMITKKPFEDLEKCIIRVIERNFSSFHRKEDEYDYLVNCVNTCIQIFIENGLYRISEDAIKFKKVKFEELGESIFTRAAKKIFGDDFKIEKQESQNTQINPSKLSREDRSFVDSRIKKYLGDGYDTRMAVDKAFGDLTMKHYMMRMEEEKSHIDALRDPNIDIAQRLFDQYYIDEDPFDDDDWEEDY